MTDNQEKLFVMLKWFHEYCQNNDINYYLIGGTLLGAVRHKGYIPWDDDLDVALYRDDYNKLISSMGNQIFNNAYKLETPLSSNDYVYPFCKIYDINTTLVENTRYKTKRGIYIDIFPIDGIGNSEEEALQNYRKISFYNNLLNTRICAIAAHRSFLKNTAIIISRIIPDFLIDWKKIIAKINKIASSKKVEENDYIVNPFGNWKEKEIFRKEWFGKPLNYTFEGYTVLGPQNADAVLNHMYGNYMELPPVEKRKTHHDYLFCDLEKSYLE